MSASDDKLARLLRAARGGETPDEMPFGFDTRVVALWRARRGNTNGSRVALTQLLQRIGVGAAIVTVAAAAGAWWQFPEQDDPAEPWATGYAIADNAIESGALQ